MRWWVSWYEDHSDFQRKVVVNAPDEEGAKAGALVRWDASPDARGMEVTPWKAA